MLTLLHNNSCISHPETITVNESYIWAAVALDNGIC